MIIKTILLAVFIICAYYFMGKRKISDFKMVDLLFFIVIMQLITMVGGLYWLIIMVILGVMILLIVRGYMKKKGVKWINDKRVIINNGKLNFKAMIDLNYSLDELLWQLHKREIDSIESVNYAVYEKGQLSIFEYCNNYPLPIIVDGKIDFKSLLEIGKSVAWINSILSAKGIVMDDVFYAFYAKEKTFIIMRSC